MYLKAAQLAEAMQTAAIPGQPDAHSPSSDSEIGISHGVSPNITHGQKHHTALPDMPRCMHVQLLVLMRKSVSPGSQLGSSQETCKVAG